MIQAGIKTGNGSGGVAVAVVPPRTSVHDKLFEARVLAAKRRRIAIRHTTGDRVVALLEIVWPGNKSSLFLSADRYVNVPLEQTYLAAYEGVPNAARK